MILVIKDITTCKLCVTITLGSHSHVPAQLTKYFKGECTCPSDQWILLNSGTKPPCHWRLILIKINIKINFLKFICVKQRKWVLLIHCNLLFVSQLWEKKYRHMFKYIPLVWFSLSAQQHKLHSWFNCNTLTSFHCSVKEFQCTHTSAASHDLCCCSFSRKGSLLWAQGFSLCCLYRGQAAPPSEISSRRQNCRSSPSMLT